MEEHTKPAAQGKELYELRKRQKEQEQHKEQRKEALKQAPKKIGKYLLYGLGAAGIIGGAVWGIVAQNGKIQEKLSKPPLGEKIADLGSVHVARNQSHLSYNSNPPTSGWHWGDGVAGAGIKDGPVPDELVIHSMEHGAAVLWYRADLSQNEIDRLKKAFNDASGKKIMLPRRDLDVPVALTSWNYLLKLEAIDEAKIIEFIETNNDRAPEKEAI